MIIKKISQRKKKFQTFQKFSQKNLRIKKFNKNDYDLKLIKKIKVIKFKRKHHLSLPVP